MRLNGQSTSIRLEKVFWTVLEAIAAREDMTLPRFISTLHQEVLLLWGDIPNFTSHLRCISLVAIENKLVESNAQTPTTAVKSVPARLAATA
jgi:predicted DNA-binding ribbon-helix-helix protein